MGIILVVEDDPMNAKLFEYNLRRLGRFDVVVTEDAEEIIETVSKGDVDGIVMDISLNNTRYKGEIIDGIGLTSLIKSKPDTSYVPVILATAHAMKGDRLKFLEESGADDYIAKPIVDPSELIEKLNRLIERKSASQADGQKGL